jgi:hypothetical protein
MTTVQRIVFALATLTVASSLAVSAQAEPPPAAGDPLAAPAAGVGVVLLGDQQQIRTGCYEAAYLATATSASSSNLLVCHGGRSGVDPWAQVSAKATQVQASAVHYFESLGGPSIPALCGTGTPSTVVSAAAAALKAGQDVLAKAKIKLAEAIEGQTTLAARTPKPTTAESAAANAQVAGVNAAIILATAALVPLEKADADARAAAKAVTSAATLAAQDARAALHAALEAAMGVSTSDFERAVADPKRLSACITLRGEVLAMYTEARQASIVKSEAAEEQLTRESARATDVLRKSSAITSAVNGGTGLLDTVGTPDHVVFSAMSALGADSKVVGTQVVSQLNLASIFEPDDAKRLALPAFTRNVFLRAALPLSSTENQPQTGGADAAATAAAATRFSMLLGGSIFDDADPRLASAQGCYDAVYGYRPAAFFEKNADAVKAVRKGLLDVCTREVARRHRLAWRAGAGFVTVGDKTKLEVLATALVYAPTSAIYFNAIYQNLRAPSVRHAFGGGWSLGMNVGGPDSGVDAWGRIGLDFTMLGIYQPDKPSGAQFDWQASIAPTLRARVFGSQFFTLGVGPRKIGSSEHFDVLATFALTADADTLVNGLLSPPAPAPAAPTPAP